MYKVVISTVLVLMLSACATPEPIIKTEIQTVKVPVPIPCATEIPLKPDFNFDKLSLDKDIFEKVKALLADKSLHLGYEKELLTALKSCK
jgi:hypothetical protein